MRSILLAWIAILAMLLIAVFAYPQLPEKIPQHWGANGEINAYGGRLSIFLLPAITFFMVILFTLLPRIDPLKKNIAKFREQYEKFILVITLFMLVIFLTIIYASFGHGLNITTIMLIALGLLFYCISNLLRHARRNWFIGIRTPWTLSSDIVWKKTHAKSAKLFKLLGILMVALGLVSLLSKQLAAYCFAVLIIAIFALAIYLFVYSYLEFKKIKGKK